MELRVINISSAVGWSRLRLATPTLGILPMLVLAACGSSPTAPSDASTSFNGVIASGTLTGALSFSVATTTLNVVRAPGATIAPAVAGPAFAATAADVVVTGTLKLVGSSAIQLTGTYNTSNHALSLAGGGYTFTGTFANGRIDGTFTSPTESGTFSVQPSANATIRNYCGTYSGSTDHGHFNIAVNVTGGTLSGAWASEMDGSTGGLSGTTSGSAVTINVLQAGAPNGTVATGTFTTTSLSGTYSGSGSDSGTIASSICS
jgi:hypothetical protein